MVNAVDPEPLRVKATGVALPKRCTDTCVAGSLTATAMSYVNTTCGMYLSGVVMAPRKADGLDAWASGVGPTRPAASAARQNHRRCICLLYRVRAVCVLPQEGG